MKKPTDKNPRRPLSLQSKNLGSSSPLGVRVHFVGIGGIGMCGLAELLQSSGSWVTGSDLVASPQATRLNNLGIPVFIGHRKSNIGQAEILVQSSAVPDNNIEIQTAKAQKIPILKRSEALAEVMRLKRGLVVAGTHGKTTTTHFLSLIFVHNKKDPTVVIGGRSQLFKSTAFLGKGEWFIAESDESDGGFKNLSVEIALITNIDRDHVDYYGSFKKLKEAFLKFALKTPFYGAVVACGDDPILRSLLSSIDRKVIFYGFHLDNDFVLKKISALKYKVFRSVPKNQGGASATDIKEIGTFHVPLYGAMNALNALGAVSAGMTAGLSFKECTQSFQNFKGLDRRFQKKGEVRGIKFYDDYAHHPTEIKAVLSAFREKYIPKGDNSFATSEKKASHSLTFKYGKCKCHRYRKSKRLVVLFQPHRFSRTKACWADFLHCFKEADYVFLMDIYVAGEKPLKGISSKQLAKEISDPPVHYCPSADIKNIPAFLKKGDVFITMGAGSVYKEGEQILLATKKLKSARL